jgi:hypothetical protein
MRQFSPSSIIPNAHVDTCASRLDHWTYPLDHSVTLSHHMKSLTFIETPTFTRLITDLVSDDVYAAFQKELVRNPVKGGPMSGCGGVRKARLALPGRGKRGGARVVYLYPENRDTIYLIYIFTKGEADNLSAAGKTAVRELAQQIKQEYHG